MTEELPERDGTDGRDLFVHFSEIMPGSLLRAVAFAQSAGAARMSLLEDVRQRFVAALNEIMMRHMDKPYLHGKTDVDIAISLKRFLRELRRKGLLPYSVSVEPIVRYNVARQSIDILWRVLRHAPMVDDQTEAVLQNVDEPPGSMGRPPELQKPETQH